MSSLRDPMLQTVVSGLRTFKYHAHSIWLFTASDLKTIVGPSTVFGLANSIAYTEFGFEQQEKNILKSVIQRSPLVLLYAWINLLPFAINNQRSPDAIKEDALNKPWRTLPSKRMTLEQADRLMFTMYVVAVGASCIVGGLRQSLALVLLGAWYNNFAGGDCSCILRNLINALGYVCFTSGALEVALGFSLSMQVQLMRWFGAVAAIIFSIVHLQDMYDQVGDRQKGRLTVPLVFGDLSTRRLTAFLMIAWGYTCPRLWTVGSLINTTSFLLTAIIAVRSIKFKTPQDDLLTFKIWNAWMGLVFSLPLLSHLQH